MKCKFFLLICLVSLSLQTSAATFEIRTAPFAFVVRWLTLDFSYAFHKNWAAGPSAILYAGPLVGQIFGPDYGRGYAVGGHIYGYFKSFSDRSWYWGNHFYFENYDSQPHNFDGHYHLEGYKFNSKIGFQAFIRPQFPVHVGAGLEVRSYGEDKIANAPGTNPNYRAQSGVFPFIEIKMGFKF